MKNGRVSFLKVFMSLLLSSAVLGAFVYVCLKGDLKNNILSFACVGVCLVLSLMFVRRTAKKILFTIALATIVVADYFLVLMPSTENQLIGVCVLCGVQVLFALYTLTLTKSIGIKVLNLAIRVALCMLAYFLIPQYFVLTTLQMLYAMILINSFLTVIALLFKFKTEWLSLIGFVLFFAFDCFSALNVGWSGIFKFPAKILTFLTKYNLAYYCFIPAVLILALSSVWEIGTNLIVASKQKKTTTVQKTQVVNKTISQIPSSTVATNYAQGDEMSTFTLDDL